MTPASTHLKRVLSQLIELGNGSASELALVLLLSVLYVLVRVLVHLGT